MTDNQRCHKIMGLCWHDSYESPHSCYKCGHIEPCIDEKNPDYENSIQDAWKLVEWMVNKKRENIDLPISINFYYSEGDDKWNATFCGIDGFCTEDTAPKAIVAAFLSANGGQDD